MRVLRIALLLMVVAGCGDPGTRRLAAGTKATAVSPYEGSEAVYLCSSTGGPIFPGMSLGTHVTVVSDSEGRGADLGTRNVTVHVEDGAHAGESGLVTRHSLRPE